jgi:hypothetical protein
VTGDPGPRTPVVAGVGQVSERLDDPGDRRRSPADLAAVATRAAPADTWASPAAVAAALGHGGDRVRADDRADEEEQDVEAAEVTLQRLP